MTNAELLWLASEAKDNDEVPAEGYTYRFHSKPLHTQLGHNASTKKAKEGYGCRSFFAMLDSGADYNRCDDLWSELLFFLIKKKRLCGTIPLLDVMVRKCITMYA